MEEEDNFKMYTNLTFQSVSFGNFNAFFYTWNNLNHVATNEVL